MLALLTLTTAAAQATPAHHYVSQFGSPGSAAGSFAAGGPSTLVVNQTSGDVLVMDDLHTTSDGSFAPRVERFNATGEFQSSFATDAAAQIYPNALAIDPSGSDALYVGGFDNVTQASGTVQKYSSAGVFEYTLDASTSATTITYPVALAVDPTDGTVYVGAADAEGLPVIDSFDNTGAFIKSFDGSEGSPDGRFSLLSALAVDSAHNLYVLDATKNRVDRFNATGAWQATVDDGSRGAPGALTIDPAANEPYILEAGPSGQQVIAFSATGKAPTETFGAGHITAAAGLAVNHTSGTVYTADAAPSVVERFTSFLAPTVTTEGTSAISAAEATLEGKINPEGVSGTTNYRFEYGLDTNYGTPTTETDTGGGSSDVAAAATISGLQPATTYHYRLFGSNPSGSSAGADATFTTAAAQVTVDQQSPFASTIGTGSATFNATLNPNGADTTYHFEYGTSTAYGSSTTDADAGSALGEVPVNIPVTALTPGTEYHFRLVADNGIGGVVQGADATFTTAPATTLTASNITSNTATLHATLIPGINGANYSFEYGTDTSYGKTTTGINVSSSSSQTPASAEVTQLSPGTTYHFRLNASINGQSVASDDAIFTTIAAAAVSTTPITAVTPITATLNASIDTHGHPGTYAFAISSPNSAYALTTARQALSATSGPQSVSIAISNLPPGAEFLVRASATVAGTTTWGEQASFETPGLPPFIPPPPPPSISANPYGCTAPHIDPVNVHPKAGTPITLIGSDLGVGGAIALGSIQIQPTSWSAGAISFQVPEGASGTQPLTVNCGTPSNTVGLAVLAIPSNAFTITKSSTKGPTAKLTVQLPGAGKLQVSNHNTVLSSATISRASTAVLTVRLSKAGKKALDRARSKRLSVALSLTFTPADGTAAAKTQTVTFKRGGSR
jgi:hypothetical protein